MQDIFGSVRRSLVFRPTSTAGGCGGGDSGGGGGFSDHVTSCLRNSRIWSGFFSRLQSSLRPLPSPLRTCGEGGGTADGEVTTPPAIRWRKGELIGCGAYGHVYMGMNLDSGELLAVKQVIIGTSNASKEKAQSHIHELEEEVKLLRNLSHANIVRYLGTAREEGTLNILLEFVPGGSISSLLGKFGSFPEAVIRMYTKQILQGLEYLHLNGIIHRDIKGANILVDNKGCIKLADFGASKQVAKLATMTAAKSMKGTPYWMAPEVIVQSGHSFSADIWSVGCTVIEMATGKPPWSQQYQEVAALFHVGTTKSHPPIPEHLSTEAKDFLLQCLQQEPNVRPTASDLLKHPFVNTEFQAPRTINHSPAMDQASASNFQQKNSSSAVDFGTGNWSELCANNFSRTSSQWKTDAHCDILQLDREHDRVRAGSMRNQSFNPISEPLDDDWSCKLEAYREENDDQDNRTKVAHGSVDKSGYEFSFPCGPVYDDDDEIMEMKIRAFLNEKALDLKKLQTPLYEEFYSIMQATNSPSTSALFDKSTDNFKLTQKCKSSPNNPESRPASPCSDNRRNVPPGNSRKIGISSSRILKEIPLPRSNDWVEFPGEIQQGSVMASQSFSEIKKKWKEELDQELESQREKMRQASSVACREFSKKKNRFRFLSPGK